MDPQILLLVLTSERVYSCTIAGRAEEGREVRTENVKRKQKKKKKKKNGEEWGKWGEKRKTGQTEMVTSA